MESSRANNLNPKTSRRFSGLRTLRSKLPRRLQNPKVLVLILFMGGFAAVGSYLLMFSKAEVAIKAQFSGTVDRQGQPRESSYYPNPVNGFVVKNPLVPGSGKTDTKWAELQPTHGGPIAENNAIDQAIAHARGLNSQGANPQVRLKLRVYVGFGAPEWAKNLPVTSGQQGPFEICNQNTGDGPICGTIPCAEIEYCGTVGHFWEQNFRDAYAELQTKLAAKYDGVPEIAEVAITGCSTSFGEPFLRQADLATNITAYQTAGYNEAANKACFTDALNAHRVWTTTGSAIALNPYNEYDTSDPAAPRFRVNEDYTEQYMDECRRVLGERCVLGNNSIGKHELTYTCAEIGAAGWSTKEKYGRMYTKIKCLGAPIYFQTATAAKIASEGNTLSDVLQWAVDMGAGMVELPAGYDNSSSTAFLTPAQLASFDSALDDNSRPAVQSAPTVTSVSPATGSTAGGTAVTITGTNFESGATVKIGGLNAANVNRISSTSITATTPAHAEGAVNVKVINPSSAFATLSSGFTYSTAEGNAGCNHNIPATVGEVDGQANYAEVQPGNILCIPGGSRGALVLNNLNGTAEAPIIIRNTGSPVTINIPSGTGAVVIKNSSYVRVTGTGVSNKCGSGYATTDQQCGFVLTGAGRGISATNNIDHIETDHLEIKATGSAGIKIHDQDNPNLVITGVNIHHNYVHDINVQVVGVADSPSEGMYIGANAPPTVPGADDRNMEDVEVSYNLVENTAWDGINIKQGIRNVKVHHNIIKNAGFRKSAGQASGIALREVLFGDIYNNFVSGSGFDNIKTGKTGDINGRANNKYFNNVLIGAGDNGLEMDANELDPKIYNNTIVTSPANGIKLAASGTAHQVYDNIVVGSGATPIAGTGGNISNNHLGTVASAGFVNSANGDYHLSSTSPAVDAGRNTGLFPAFDYEDRPRPSGAKTDQGAFEYVSPVDSTTPTDVTLSAPVSPLIGFVNLSSTASDNTAVTRVEFLHGSTVIATATTPSSGTAQNGTWQVGWDTTTVTNGTYSLTSNAYDAANNATVSPPVSVEVNNAPVDTSNPTNPSSLRLASPATHNQVSLVWNASTDNVGVTRYQVFRGANGAAPTFLIGIDATSTTFLDTYGITENTNYSYFVKAKDAAGNVSDPSNTLQVNTPQSPDTQPPTAPTTVTVSENLYNKVSLTWGGATDNRGVVRYIVQRNGVTLADTVTATSYTDNTVLANTAYNYVIRAVDAAGNISAAPNPPTAVTTPQVPDTNPPTAPTSLRPTVVHTQQVNLAWNAATDNVTIRGYNVYRNGTKISSLLPYLSFGDATVSPNNRYDYYVTAVDSAGLEGPRSNTITIQRTNGNK